MNDDTSAGTHIEPLTYPEKGMSYTEYLRAQRRQRVTRIRYRAARKAFLSIAGSQQALAAKAQLILAGKGRNGRSMTPALLERHLSHR